MKLDSLGDRIKNCYESRSQTHLTCRTNVIIRLDGVAFHTYTRQCEKPFDMSLINDMNETAKFLCENISGCKIGYVQSDEISLVLTDYDKFATQAWFDNNVQKMVSVSASMAASKFNQLRAKSISHKPFIEDIMLAWRAGGMSWEDIDRLRRTEPYNKFPKYSGSEDQYFNTIGKMFDQKNISFETLVEERSKATEKLAFFDSRVFVVPNLTEVHNYLVWRQQDTMRNAIQMVAQANFSHKELQGKNCDTLLQMIGDKWVGVPDGFKYGRTFYKTQTDELTPRKVWERSDTWNFREHTDWVEKYIGGFVTNE